MLLILSGPSAVGKTTLVNRLIEDGVVTRMLRSVTTRAPRHKDDNEYDFITLEEFKKLDLAESVSYVGNHYGLPMSELRTALTNPGISVVIAESEGMLAIREHAGEKCITVFMDARDRDLRRRLIARGSEGIERRIANFQNDRIRIPEYNYVIFNHDGQYENTVLLMEKLLKGWAQ